MSNPIDDTLKRLGVESYDDLRDVEKDTYDAWLKQLSTDLSTKDIQNYVEQMRNAVVVELVDEPEYIYSKILPFLKRPNPRVIHLKARLKNYLLLGAFLQTPEQAKAEIEKNLQQLRPVV